MLFEFYDSFMVGILKFYRVQQPEMTDFNIVVCVSGMSGYDRVFLQFVMYWLYAMVGVGKYTNLNEFKTMECHLP